MRNTTNVLAGLKTYKVHGNYFQDRALLDALHKLAADETAALADRLGALDYMSVVMGCEDIPATEEELRAYLRDCGL